MTFTNRWYQTEMLRQSMGLWRDGRRKQILQLPTGGGKTLIATQLVDKVGFRRVIYTVPSVEILEQTAAKFRARDIRFETLEAGDYPDLSGVSTLLAMTQTLDNRLASRLFDSWKPEVLIIDEVHRRFAQLMKLTKRFSDASVFGFTATPTRLDGKDLRDICPTFILGPSVADLQKEGFLVPSRTVPAIIPDLSDLTVTRNDFVMDEVDRKYYESGILGQIPLQWLQLARGRRTIAFAPGLRSSKAMVAAYKRKGIRALHIDGSTSEQDREEALDRLRHHDIDVLSNVGLFVEGLDLVEVECITSVRPTQSVAFHLQSLGRGLRPSPETGKKDLLIIDHSGNTVRHGPVEAERDWLQRGVSLSPNIRRCKACGSAKMTLKCGFCGWEEKYRRVNKGWERRRARKRSKRTPPRPCPPWALSLQELWLMLEQRRVQQGLPLPNEALGREGFTETAIRRELRGRMR